MMVNRSRKVTPARLMQTFEVKVKVMSNASTETLINFSKKGMSVAGIVGSVYIAAIWGVSAKDKLFHNPAIRF